MKKIILICTVLFASNAIAQSSFPSTNARWIYRFIDERGNITNWFETYEMKGDTIIASNTYKKVFKDSLYKAALRENSKKIYIIPEDSAEEYLIYDFSLNKGDTFFKTYGYGPDTNIVIRTDSMEALDGKHKVFQFMYCGIYWIEGIGSPNNLLDPFAVYCLSGVFHLECFTIGNTLIYPKYGSFCDVSIPKRPYIKNTLTITPNPFHTCALLQTGTGFEDSELSIYNSLGVLIKKENTGDLGSYLLEKGILSNGIYIIRLENKKGEVKFGKVVIE